MISADTDLREEAEAAQEKARALWRTYTENYGLVQACREQVERLKEDTTEVGTSIFRSDWEARLYYDTREEVAKKIAAGEISINPRPPAPGRWNSEGRWVEPFHAARIRQAWADIDAANRAMNEGASARNAADHESRAFTRVLTSSTIDLTHVVGRTALKRELAAALKKPWETELPYCCAGQPLYTSADYDPLERDPRNNRLILVGNLRVVVMRIFLGSTNIHWGMRSERAVHILGVGPLGHHPGPAILRLLNETP